MSTAATATYPSDSAPSVLPFHRRQLPATPIHTTQLPIPTSRPDYSPLSSGLPSPNFPSPIPLPTTIPIRGRSPAPSASSSRHPSRQQSIRRLSSISAYPSNSNPNGPAARRPSHAFDYNDFSTINEDILSEGDIIGEGGSLHGEHIELVHISVSAPRPEQDPPAARLRVVRKLGAGSYAVVYLVREILAIERIPTATEPEELSDSDSNDENRYRYSYGREFAVKCLSKASLGPEELEIQLFEAKLHQWLPTHPNIITLHRTLQTPSFLLLILEFVPGEDLFYFLEQSRDSHPHPDDSLLSVQPSQTPSTNSRPLPPVPGSSLSSNGLNLTGLGTNALMVSNTPPTPSLLSTSHPQALLSYQRLRLITSMFSQMCDAVDACHSQGVSHRDIKPENFIVTEGTRPGSGQLERKVIVKLSDFGLATLQKDSTDVDCGSAPYMSYECRNYVAPTYATQPADVWSLGIVLINMLYHHNPWSDTASISTSTAEHPRTTPSSNLSPRASLSPNQRTYACPSFSDFLNSPVQFFLQRFPGMTFPVADFLANRVFCILPPQTPDEAVMMAMKGASGYQNVGRRVTAREFGEWVKALPVLMGQGATMSFGAGVDLGAGGGGRIVAPARSGSKLMMETDWRPEEDGELNAGGKRSATREALVIETARDMVDRGDEGDHDAQDPLRSPSAKRRGKRGARRKDKSQPPSVSRNPSSSSLLDQTVSPGTSRTAADVAHLALEISRSSASVASGRSRTSARERALARLPPMPQMAPPAPPSQKTSSESHRSSINSLGPTPANPPPEPPKLTAAALRPHLHQQLQHELDIRSSIPIDDNDLVIPTPAPVATIAPKKSWMGRFKFNNSGSSSAPAPSMPPPGGAPHAAPHAHESPLSIPGNNSTLRPSLLSSPPSTSSAHPNVRTIHTGFRSMAKPRAAPSTVRPPTSPRPYEPPTMYAGLQWASLMEESERTNYGRRGNNLDIVSSPPPSVGIRRPGSQWTSGDDDLTSRAIRGVAPAAPRATRRGAAAPRAGNPASERALNQPWRSSIVSNSTTTSVTTLGTASSASSTFTQFDNSSLRSVSTVATSVSAQSRRGGVPHGGASGFDGPWRSLMPTGSDAGSVASPEAPPRPRKATKVKRMEGLSREIDDLHPRVIGGVLPPHSMHYDPRKQQASPPTASYARSHRASPILDSISERNQSSSSQSPPPSPELYRKGEAAGSTSDLDPAADTMMSDSTSLEPKQQKSVHKTQSHTFQKMLSALKTNRKE